MWMSAELEPGTIIGDRYHIDCKVGHGGMGIVYRATHLQLRRPVAIKVLQPSRTGDTFHRARFEREARVASLFRHPNAVEVHDFGEDEGFAYLVMSFLSGRTLRETLGSGNVPFERNRALQIGQQLADLLETAHRLPLVHRDLKPENVFLERNLGRPEHAVVVDFGLAFIAHNPELGRLTERGELAGSAYYISPEQARGVDVGPPADVYSLGCVLYEMLTGYSPFEGTGVQLVTRHMFSPPEPPSSRNPDVAMVPALDDLILRMLRKRPAERPSADDVMQVLRSLEDWDEAESQASRRGRLGRRARNRVERMVPGKPSPPIPHDLDLSIRVTVVGALDEDLKLGMHANGLTPVEKATAGDSDSPDVVLCLGADLDAIASVTCDGRPVVADAAPSDINRVAALVRAGVSEVITQPAALEDVVRKVRRAHRKASRV